MKRRINVVEAEFWRRRCGVALLNRMPNEEVETGMGVDNKRGWMIYKQTHSPGMDT